MMLQALQSAFGDRFEYVEPNTVHEGAPAAITQCVELWEHVRRERHYVGQIFLLDGDVRAGVAGYGERIRPFPDLDSAIDFLRAHV